MISLSVRQGIRLDSQVFVGTVTFLSRFCLN